MTSTHDPQDGADREDRGSGRPSSAPHLPTERADYTAGRLDDPRERTGDAGTEVPSPVEPFSLFKRWLGDAFARRDEHGDLPEPTAFVLSTVDLTGPLPRAASRTVLLKEWDGRGFVFYTNRRSAKGRQLASDSAAAMLLPWYPLQRQVRIEGRVEDVPDAEADAYWATRPRDSQIGAWASEQSELIDDRAALDRRAAEAESRFRPVARIPRPPHWGGYRVVPHRIEFWQGRHGRLHDRIVYTRIVHGDAQGIGPAWSAARLQP